VFLGMLKVNSFENAKKLNYTNGWKSQKSKVKIQKVEQFVSRKEKQRRKGKTPFAPLRLLCVFA